MDAVNSIRLCIRTFIRQLSVGIHVLRAVSAVQHERAIEWSVVKYEDENSKWLSNVIDT